MVPAKTFIMAALMALAASVALAQAPEKQNWFNDPFFQTSASIADCPLPAGPFITEAERRVQAHSRAEKGTTCWLSGECDRPNAYAYDQDIAAAFKRRWAERKTIPNSTLWVTVQARIVYIEGCVADEAVVAELEAFAKAVPHVQQAMAIVRTNPSAPPPYKLR